MAGSQPISSFDGAYASPHYRDSTMMAPVAPPSPSRGPKTRIFSTEFLASKWAKLFFGAVALQAIACATFEA